MSSGRAGGERTRGGAGAVAVSAMMTAIFAALLAEAAHLHPEARLAPLVVGIPALALALAQLVVETRSTIVRARAESNAGSRVARDAQRQELHRALTLVGWLIALLILCVAFGVLIAFPAFIFAFLRWREAESVLVSTAVALGFTATVYAVFERLLDLPLWRGLLPALIP